MRSYHPGAVEKKFSSASGVVDLYCRKLSLTLQDLILSSVHAVAFVRGRNTECYRRRFPRRDGCSLKQPQLILSKLSSWEVADRKPHVTARLVVPADCERSDIHCICVYEVLRTCMTHVQLNVTP